MKSNENSWKTDLNKITLKYLLPVLFLLPYFVFCLQYDDEWDQRSKLTRYWCKRLRSCVPSNKTACGWDKGESFLAVFENICILYRANCRGAGKFHEVEMIICETQKNYSRQHPNGEEFEWIHIEGGTSAATTTIDPLTATNKSDLRHHPEAFRTLYPEGGTLPPHFFNNDESKSVEQRAQTTPPSRDNLSDSEWRVRLLQLLWRKSNAGSLVLDIR